MSGERVMAGRSGPGKFMRTILRKSSKPSPIGGPLTTPQPVALPARASRSTEPSEDFLDDTLARLTEEEQAIIRQYIAPNTADIATAVGAAYDAALVKQKQCEEKRWQPTFLGRRILLRDVAGKVLLWLDRFKAVGDVAANADPLHAGLPWAGIRIILEVAVADINQMAALLTGMSHALYITNRLKVYFNYYRLLPPTLATKNFEKVLIKTYAHVLRFIAKALRAYQMNGGTRRWYALWQTPALADFETECETLASQVETEASNCDRELSKQRWKEASHWMKDLETDLRKLEEIQAIKDSINLLHDKADLAKLSTAPDATYNSYADDGSGQCLKGTRTLLLDKVANWADDPNGKCIFWLNGMAGTGKSTIARTVADLLNKQGHLAASFFFKRGESDRASACRFFPTIAAQLADKIPGLSHSIAQALDADSLLCQRNLQEQFDKLLSEPLSRVAQSMTPSSVIVIDALDECDRSGDIEIIIKFLANMGNIRPGRLRIFVTSRPEFLVQRGFQRLHRDLHHDMILEEVQASTIGPDLRIYFKHRFEEIKSEYSQRHPYDTLPVDWPGDDSIEALVRLANPLFIFAFTVCRFILESHPQERLDTILQQRQHVSFSGIEKTYLPILDQLLVDRDARQHDQVIAEFKAIVGPIVLLANPLSAQSLSVLLRIPRTDIGETLSRLHSVLSVPADPNISIRPLHISFREFLVNQPNDANRFWIDKVQTHRRLAKRCIQRLNQPGTLRKNLCGLRKPGSRRLEIDKQRVANAIDADVAYACQYFVWHLTEGEEKITDDGYVHGFLQSHFLHWLEALSWLGRLSSAVGYIRTLRSLVKVDQGAELLDFLEDARRFLLRNRFIINTAPQQLYLSALIFTPMQSIIRRQFGEHADKWPCLLPRVPLRWSPEIQKLEGHNGFVWAVAFSPDGQVVASGSDDRTMRLWDATTGEEMLKLEGHDNYITALDFSQDGQIIASGSQDKTVRLWNATTGEEIQKLEGHEGSVTAVVFSPDGQIVASGSDDKTVRLWDATTGEVTQKFEGHENFVTAVAFSPNGGRVVSGSDDQTVRLWNVATGEEMLKLEGHEKYITAVDFSPDGQIVASGSDDQTVRLWDVTTGKETRKLEGHEASVAAVAFSPNGQTVVSGSDDRTVRLWDATTGEEMRRLEGHNGFVKAVAFSPDGQTVASGSWDMTVRPWNATTGEETQRLEGHDRAVTAVVFSPDGQIVASGSDDQTVRLWDATTGEETRKLEGHERPVTAMAFSPDGQVVVSGSEDGTVRLWNATTGTETQKLEGHGRSVTAVAFSPSGQVVASGSEDRTVRLWNPAGSEQIGLFYTGGYIAQLAFANGGKTLVTNQESFDLGLSTALAPAPSPTHTTYFKVKDQWIRYKAEDTLWLPHEYRSAVLDSHGNKLVIGQKSGAMSFFHFNVDDDGNMQIW